MMQIKTKFTTKSEFYTILCLSVCVCAKQSIVYWWLIFYTLIKLILESFAGSIYQPVRVHYLMVFAIWDPKWRLNCPRNFRPPPWTLPQKLSSSRIDLDLVATADTAFFLSVSRTSIVTQSRDRVFSYYYKLYIVLKERRTVCTASFYTALRNLSNCLTTQLGRELEGCVAESGTLQRRLHRAKTRHNENKNTYWEFHMSKETWIKPDEVFLSFRLWFLLVSLVLCPRWSGSTRLPPPFWHWTEVYKRITSLQININISDTRLIDGISSSSSSSLCATSFFVYVYTDDIRGCTRRMKWNKM